MITSVLLTNQQALNESVEKWRQLDCIGIDTEFVRTRTYYAKLGLVQVYDGHISTLIDPLAIECLDPLLDLIVDPRVIKVLHAGSEDVEIIRRLAQRPPAGLFDTQIAAALIGLGPSLSYTALVDGILGETLPKAETRSDWLKRPLSESQCRYAAADVSFLLALYRHLSDALRQRQRCDWAEEEFQRLENTPLPGENIEAQFQRFKFAWRLDAKQRLLLLQLLGWREETARQKDLPRRHVLNDDSALAIATQQPQTRKQLAQLAGIGERTARRYAAQLLDLVANMQDMDEAAAPEAPPRPPSPADRERMKQLRDIVRECAANLGLEAELLCGRRDMVSLLQTGHLPQRLCGWRYKIIGQVLEAAMQTD